MISIDDKLIAFKEKINKVLLVGNGLDDICNNVRINWGEQNIEIIRDSAKLTKQILKKIYRRKKDNNENKIPFFNHPENVAKILSNLGYGPITIASGYSHDNFEQTHKPLEIDLIKFFMKYQPMNLVKTLFEIDSIKEEDLINLKKIYNNSVVDFSFFGSSHFSGKENEPNFSKDIPELNHSETELTNQAKDIIDMVSHLKLSNSFFLFLHYKRYLSEDAAGLIYSVTDKSEYKEINYEKKREKERKIIEVIKTIGWDLRGIIIKSADRLDNLLTIEAYKSKEDKTRIINDTYNNYLPILKNIDKKLYKYLFEICNLQKEKYNIQIIDEFNKTRKMFLRLSSFDDISRNTLENKLQEETTKEYKIIEKYFQQRIYLDKKQLEENNFSNERYFLPNSYFLDNMTPSIVLGILKEAIKKPIQTQVMKSIIDETIIRNNLIEYKGKIECFEKRSNYFEENFKELQVMQSKSNPQFIYLINYSNNYSTSIKKLEKDLDLLEHQWQIKTNGDIYDVYDSYTNLQFKDSIPSLLIIKSKNTKT